MGSARAYTGDWMRANQARYLSDDTPDDAFEAAQHVLAARAALEMGESEVAEYMYRRAQMLWRRMENTQPGRWREELANTASEARRSHHGPHH